MVRKKKNNKPRVKPKQKKKAYYRESEGFILRRKIRFFLLKSWKLFQLFLLLTVFCILIWVYLFKGDEVAYPYIDQKTNEILINLGLGIQEVEIEGNKIVSTNEIVKKVLNYISASTQKNILLLNLEDLEAVLRQFGWIEKAAIRKKFPGNIIIKIDEREPEAIWQENKELYLIDSNGNLITDKVTNEYLHLPLIIGTNPQKEVIEFFDIIQSSPYLYSFVKEGKKTGNRRWDINLDNGVLIKLPEEEPEKAWKKLTEIEKESRILSKNIDYIDLRIENQIVTGVKE